MSREKSLLKTTLFGWGAQIFDWLASLKLAIIILIILMISLAAGTFLESAHNASVARAIIYESPWFQGVLFLLALNLTASALERLPWKRKHVGFVLTHLGIIMLLLGSYITQRFMVDGQMVIAEGETSQQISVPQPTLYIQNNQNHAQFSMPLKTKPFIWKGRDKISSADPRTGLPDLFLREFYPQATRDEVFQSAQEGPAAIQVKVESAVMNDTLWLVEGDHARSQMQLGPSLLSFSNQKIQKLESGQSKAGYLDIVTGKSTYHVQIPEDVKPSTKLTVPGSEIEIEIVQIFHNAFVNNKNVLEEAAAEGPAMNPALKIILRKGAQEEKHTTFAKFPDFPSIHGMGKDGAEAATRIYYHVPETGAETKTELRLVPQGDQILYQVKAEKDLKEGLVKIGESFEPGWMDFKFTPLQYFPKSRVSYEYHSVPSGPAVEGAAPALQIELSNGQESQSLWLGQGVPEPVTWNGQSFTLMTDDKIIPAGFQLTLKDFRLENYQGTSNPMSFESDVELMDPLQGVMKKTTISMNEPLSYKGFKIYQSGYNVAGDGPEVSIFSVGRDPGIWIKYLGTIVMVAGIILTFYTRKYSHTTGKL